MRAVVDVILEPKETSDPSSPYSPVLPQEDDSWEGPSIAIDDPILQTADELRTSLASAMGFDPVGFTAYLHGCPDRSARCARLHSILRRIEPFCNAPAPNGTSEQYLEFLKKVNLDECPSAEALERAGKDNTEWYDPLTREALQDFYRLNSLDTFVRMDEKRIEFAAKNIIFGSEIPEHATPFMVVQHTQQSFKVRFSNSVLSNLQLAVESFLRRVGQNVETPNYRIRVSTLISVYEHGHEESTISGDISWGKRRWWWYLRREARTELIAFGVVASLCLVSLGLGLTAPTTSASGQFFDRLSTATLVSSLTLLVVLVTRARGRPLVVWDVNRARTGYDDPWTKGRAHSSRRRHTKRKWVHV
jgi:hypothetical protein